MNRKIIIAFFAVVFVICAIFAAMSYAGSVFKREGKKAVSSDFANKNEKSKESKDKNLSDGKNEKSTKTNTEKENTLIPLKNKLSEYISSLDGKWAIYVENLKTDEKIEINNEKMVSASLIKLFIMAKTYDDAKSKVIDLKKAAPYLEKMITVSDNEASNELVSIIGGGKYSDMYEKSFRDGRKIINEYSKSIGCTFTDLQRDMKNSRPKPIAEQNFTSVSDCGLILSKIYKKTLVTKEFDEEMMSLLKRQTRRGKIPAGLPKNTVCANKTGELSDVENDCAIVFSPACDYIICVMSNDVPNTFNARNSIVKISETVYNFFNPKN